MKHYIPFTVAIGVGLGISLWPLLSQNDCLFTFQGHCYTCDDQETFFVGLPENCAVCPNRHTQYINWDGKSIWACLKSPIAEDDEIEFQESVPDTSCPKEKPLQDILGHCYDCHSPEPVQISDSKENICIGKRYLTRYRNSEKSHPCPPTSHIQDPYICVACHGQWQNEKCIPVSLKPMDFCQKNSDCSQNQWCYPFGHKIYSKSGICRPLVQQKWICSNFEGYTYESAQIFCARQNAHLPTFKELEAEKELALLACSNTNIWTIFDEGSIYLDSLKSSFPITKEKETFELGGDNTYALCIQN